LDVAGFGKGINRAVKDVSRFQRTMGKITRGLSFFGGAFGLGFTGTALARGLVRRIDQIDNLAAEAEKTGVSLTSLGVSLDKNAIGKVRKAAQEIDKLKSSWSAFRDEVVAQAAGPMTRWLDVVNSGRSFSFKEIVAGKNTGPAIELPKKAGGPEQDALGRLVEARRLRFATPIDHQRRAASIAAQRAQERADAFANTRGEQETARRTAAIRVREGNLRRKIMSGQNIGDESLQRQLTGGPAIRPMTSNGRNPLWDMVRQSSPVNDAQKELKQLNDTQKKALDELKRLDEIWAREMMRRANEAEGTTIN